jgi:hypothetical protein
MNLLNSSEKILTNGDWVEGRNSGALFSFDLTRDPTQNFGTQRESLAAADENV